MSRKTLLRIALWLFASTLGAATLLYLVLLGINWRDEPPSAAAIKLQAVYDARAKVADVDNGFVYAMGMAERPEGDPRAEGMRRVALSRQPTSSIERYDGFTVVRSPQLQGFINVCKQANAACLSALETDEQMLAEWLRSEAWLLQRYETLLTHTHWSETVPFSANQQFPLYSRLMDGQRLWLATAWQSAEKQDAVAVRELLAQDLRFWSRTLQSSDWLIDKMIAVAAINQHFTLGSLLLGRLPAAAIATAIPAEWNVEMSAAERSMARCFAAEWIYGNTVQQQMLGSRNPEDSFLSWHLTKSLYQPQASSNKRASYLVELSEILDTPYAQYATAMSGARAAEQRLADSLHPIPGPYNIVGEVLLAGSYEYSAYAARVADIEGVRRAAVLANNLRSRGVTAEQMATALEESDIRTPYSNTPFEWDSAQRSIVFTGLQTGERGRYAVLY